MDLFHFHILEPFFLTSIKIKASGRCERLTPVPQRGVNIMSTRDYICPVHPWTFNVAAVSCKHLLQDNTLVQNGSRSSVFLPTAKLNFTKAARKLQAHFISSIPLHSRWDADLFFNFAGYFKRNMNGDLCGMNVDGCVLVTISWCIPFKVCLYILHFSHKKDINLRKRLFTL